MTRLVTLALSAVLCTAIAASAQDIARMDQVIQSHVSAGTFMGTVLVARDGAVIVDKAYGMANVEWDVPNTTATKFRLGSITKQFTAAAILLLEERGKLKIDDRVKSYLPDSPMAWDRITIFNLLTHTAGIPNFTASPDYNTIKLSSRSAEAAVTSFRDRPLDFGPGEQMSYSNSGYLVLGSIIEKVSGQSYEKFVTDNLFVPAGMTDSGYDSNSAIIKRRASGYMRTPAGLTNAGYLHMSIPHAAGALYSTTHDLLKWEQALFAGRIVSKASLDRMITPFKNDYALGLTAALVKGRRVIAHGGGIDGFNTHLAYYPDSRTVVIVLSNVNGTVPGALAGQLGALMHGDSVTLTTERTAITVPAATLATYVGAYELSPNAVMTITQEGDGLMAQLTGQGRLAIFPQSETLFFVKVVDAQIEFAADGASMVLHQNGRSTKAARRAPTAALPPDPMVGAWKLNLAKSTYVTPAPKSMTVTIAPAARGYAFTVEAIGPDGQPQKWGFTSAFDGSESQVVGTPLIDAVVASSSGSGGTIRYKKAGNVITTTTSAVSDDSSTLVVTIKIPDAQGKEFTNVAVYERR